MTECIFSLFRPYKALFGLKNSIFLVFFLLVCITFIDYALPCTDTINGGGGGLPEGPGTAAGPQGGSRAPQRATQTLPDPPFGGVYSPKMGVAR